MTDIRPLMTDAGKWEFRTRFREDCDRAPLQDPLHVDLVEGGNSGLASERIATRHLRFWRPVSRSRWEFRTRFREDCDRY